MKTKLTLFITVLAFCFHQGYAQEKKVKITLDKGLLWQHANHELKTDASKKYVYSMLPGYTVPRSISFWVNPSKLPGEAKLFWGQGLGIGMNGGRVKVYWYVSGWNGGDGYGQAIWCDTPKDQWTHISSAVFMDGTIKIRAYLNGKLVEEIDTKKKIGGALGPDLNIGWDGRGNFFDGKLANIRIYNRALSTEEVKALYDLEKPKAK